MARSKLKKKLKSPRAKRVPAHGKSRKKGSGLPPWWFLIIVAVAGVLLFYLVFWNLAHYSRPLPLPGATPTPSASPAATPTAAPQATPSPR